MLLEDNEIKSISDIENLNKIFFLSNLTLTGNPICSVENYRSKVLANLRRLIFLDSKNIFNYE